MKELKIVWNAFVVSTLLVGLVYANDLVATEQLPLPEALIVQDEAETLLPVEISVLEGELDGPVLFTRPLRTNKPEVRRNAALPQYASSTEPYLPPNSLLRIPGILENPRTQHYISHYSSREGKRLLENDMRRAAPYLAFIRAKIAEMDLPPELIYLPIIESSYTVTARSRAGAVGLWQFMTNSIAPFDMKVTEWMDERRDFWKSTEGALRKLQENYHHFNDWALALAAYNAGLGGVNRIVEHNGSADYWELSARGKFKYETIQYVPRLAAVAYVLSNRRRFEVELLWADDPQWQRIPVGNRSVDLTLLADRAGVDGRQLRWANQELTYGVTPPHGGYNLKVRAADAQRIAEVLSQNDIPLLHYHIHIISYGDTLLALARRYGVTVSQVQSANSGITANNLRIGSRLLIPALTDAHPPETAAVAKDDLPFNGTHLVKRGETLWSLAMGYGVNPELLAAANGMSINDVLREGRLIKTPIR